MGSVPNSAQRGRPWRWRRAYEHPNDRQSLAEARRCFFDAIRDRAPEVLDDLASEPLAVFRPYGENCFSLLSDDQQRASYLWLDWRWTTFKYADSQVPAEVKLRDLLIVWARRWGLEDEWCLDAAVETLASWSSSDQDAEHRDWAYAGLEMVSIEIPRRACQFTLDCNGWNPQMESWESARARLKEKFDEAVARHRADLERLAEDHGLVPVKRSRMPNDEHFDWLACYQVKRASYSQIAWSVRRGRQTVKDAILEKSDMIGLTRRESDPPGRPRRAKPKARIVRMERRER